MVMFPVEPGTYRPVDDVSRATMADLGRLHTHEPAGPATRTPVMCPHDYGAPGICFV